MLFRSVALKQAPKVYQTLFHKYFTTKVKEFIKLIKNNDIYELNELLVKLETGTSIYALINNKSATDSIESVSLNQLNQISQLFNQGEMSQ